jgi:hypothetical protein
MQSHRAALLASVGLAVALPAFAQEQDVNVEAEIVPLDGWTYDELYATGISLDQLIGADVIGPEGDDDIGDVENVLFDQEGRVLSIVAEVGGFLELGDTHVNIPWDQVEVMEGGDEVRIPITEETAEEYTLFSEAVVGLSDVEDIQQVSGDNAGEVLTGPQVWRATDLIGDYARLRDGDTWVNYGYVDDAIIRDGQIVAVVAGADVTWGAPGRYAYPYYGAWNPGMGFYDLPYDRTEVEGLEPFDDDLLVDD